MFVQADITLIMEDVLLELHVVLILNVMMMAYVFVSLGLLAMMEFAQSALKVLFGAQKQTNAFMFVVKIQSTLNLLLPVSATLDMEYLEAHAKLAQLTTLFLVDTVLLAQSTLITIVLRKVVNA